MKKEFRLTVPALFVATALITFFGCSSKAQQQASRKGFVPIFDGKTLNGWEGDPTYWRVENGMLVGEITPATKLQRNSFIIYNDATLKDFELQLEFKITTAGNSGINYRSERLADVPYALKGYQADIDGAHRYTGQNYEERARTTLAYRGEKVVIPSSTGPFQSHLKSNAWTERTITGSLGHSDTLKTKLKSEDWNSIRLIVKGNRLQHYVNGFLMSDVTDNDETNRKMEGLLGVQVHVGPPMKVEYRNMYLKKL